MSKLVKFEDARHRPDTVVRRDCLWGAMMPRFGRSTVTCDCPFCGCYVNAYCWSLAGCGKRCPKCKALLSRTVGVQFKDKVIIKDAPAATKPFRR